MLVKEGGAKAAARGGQLVLGGSHSVKEKCIVAGFDVETVWLSATASAATVAADRLAGAAFTTVPAMR